jgi:hypothetical protein
MLAGDFNPRNGGTLIANIEDNTEGIVNNNGR